MASPFLLWRAAMRARRLYPVAAMAYERWKALPEEEKERYRRQAREFAKRGVDEGRRGIEAGRRAIEKRRRR